MTTSHTEPQGIALQEYLQLRLHTFLRSVASAGLRVSEDEAMRVNAAMWTRDYHEREAAHARRDA